MKSNSLATVLYVSLSLVMSVQAMPPAPGVKITQAELDERVRLGIDVVQRPLRSAGTRGIVNRPGDVTPLVVGTIPFPVVAIKYPDFANTYSVAEFQNMLFGTWFSGSARDYYHEVSYNQFHMSGTVVGWYTAANNKAYYGYSNGWTRAAMLVKEAAAASDSAVDYSIYDIDGDGYVDAFTCIHAGYGTEESGSGSDIWSHAWSFSDAGIGAYTTNDPRPGYPGQYIKIDDYTTDPERSNRSNYGTMVSIGVYCHEWGHALGLPDLYDTDGGGEGLGNWTLMAGGSWGGNGNSPYYPVHLDPWSKMELGWLCPTAVRSRNLYSIPNIENSARAYWLMARERTFKEYFLVENRRKTRFDTLLYNSGLLIYHVDDSVIARRRGSNAVNNGGSGWKYGVALEQADGQDHLFNGTNRGDANDPWPGGLGRTTFDSTSTTPNSRTNYPSSATLITGCLVKNIPASAPTVQCTLGSGLVGAFTGGPDSRGYSWIDSDTAGGPHYNWVDITSTGTLLGNGDDARWSISLPYTFRYYNTNYNTVWISTNGWLSFGSDPGTNAPTNTAIPASAAPNRAVYVFWDDLNLVSSDSGYVYYQHGGTSPNCSTVIMWKNARVKGSVTYNQATFAAVLYEGGRIVLRYRDAAVTDTSYTWGRSATVGIEDENGTVGLQYIYNGTPKGNLLANERAIQFAQSGATVRDVGTTTVVAPAGTIDSGTTVTPSCTVYNYGTTTESYSVRCRVGPFYNQTASVTNHAPGVKLYVTFPAYSTWPRGTFSVTCSTELGADATPSNDKATGSVTVRVLDAQALAITAPTGTVDSGSVVVPQASVRNNGTAAATFNVRFEIQGGYSNTQTVTNLASGATTTVTFANWTATQRGALATRCTTMLAGDVVPANNLVTGSVTVRVQDVGATRVIAPAGTIDSGTVVTPACSVYNYGSTTESYNVRCKVSSFYNQTANVTNHTSGTRVYVTFPSWTALQRGTHLVSCSTELTGDAVQANDKASGSVTVRVADVGCQTLLAPSGTVDSGSSFTPACTVYNYGSASATYTVRMKIGVGYNQTTTVANHAAGTALYLTFPVWTAGLPRGSYAVSCSTELTGDMNNANDKRTGSVAVGVTDAATVALLAPSGTVDSGTAVTPACTVANYGTSAASFSVRMKVGSTYNQTAAVTNLTPGAKAYVTFAGWTATMRGSSAVTCSTELTGDLVQTNNKLTGSVTVRVRDVGCATLVSPVGAIDSGTVITPACTVVNHGTSAESYTVRMRIGTGYDRTASVSSHAPGARVYITFPTWNAGPRGPIAVSCSTQLSSDMQPTNDRQTGQVDVVVRDVACTQLLAPSGVVDSGMVITPACSMRNLGTASESYTVRMRIGAGYNQTATIANHAPGTARYVTFPDWLVDQPRGMVFVTCSTELTGDMQPANDRQTGQVEIQVHDVGCRAVTAPVGVLGLDSIIAPACTVHNYGSVSETYAVRMRIGAAYDQLVAVTSHQPGTSRYVTFPNWTAGPVGMVAVVCSTEMSGDLVSANNVIRDSVRVWAREDVGVVRISAPVGRIDTAAVVVPGAVVANYGQLPASFDVFFRICLDTATVFASTRQIAALAPDSSISVLFDTLSKPHLPGRYVTRCSTALAGDINPANDVRSDSFVFSAPMRTPGWSVRAPVPGSPTGKSVKGGAWLVYDLSTGLIYAAKGNKTADFFAYNPATDSWRQLAPIPPGREGKLPYHGATGCADGNGSIYATKGNNSLGFYRYDAARDSWYQLADVPSGLSGRKVRGGTDVVFVSSTTNGSVYLLKGGKNEFCRYDPIMDSWQTLPVAPAEKWGKGSWLAYVPGRANLNIRTRAAGEGLDLKTRICESGVFAAGTIYAHQAKYHGMYPFDVETGVWGNDIGGMPLVGRSGKSKASKDGGSSATLGSAIYAFKGGNTQEFWHFLAPTGPWTELETLPMTAPGGTKRKRVKAGADLVGYGPWDVVYGLKGNATFEFWCYTPGTVTGSPADASVSGITVSDLRSLTGRFVHFQPNPLRSGLMTASLSGWTTELSGGVVSLSLHDASGRLLRHTMLSTRHPAVTLDLRGLGSGVYLLKVETGGMTMTEKVVLQR